jgi:processive 1,2-diacylglycerol beta-glucosyltransferase
MPAGPPRVLVLSASIGEGHDLPARVLADELAERGAVAVIADGLRAMGRAIEGVLMGGSTFGSAAGNVAFDLSYAFSMRVGPVRRFGCGLLERIGGRGLLPLVARERADIVVSTYPAVTEALGRLRAHGRLGVPVVSAITDLAALDLWAHPGVDLHLVTHPESVAEVRAVAGTGTAVRAVRGLNDPAFAVPRDRGAARAALGLPATGSIVLVSGGGWGVGDLAGAVEEALVAGASTVVVLCGRNDELRARLAGRFGGDRRVRLLGFTHDLPDLLAAADALVHSTAGLTVLEANVRGCPVISYGWGRGHIRVNNRAYERFGLAAVARSRRELAGALRRALASRPAPDAAFAALPSAADAVLDCLGRLGPAAAHGQDVAQRA